MYLAYRCPHCVSSGPIRDGIDAELPDLITTELLIREYNLLSTNIFPSLQFPDVNYDLVTSVHDTHGNCVKFGLISQMCLILRSLLNWYTRLQTRKAGVNQLVM